MNIIGMVVGYILWAGLFAYWGVFFRRVVVGAWVYGLWHAKELDQRMLSQVTIEYDFYDRAQGCHFYTFYLGEKRIKNNRDRFRYGYFGYLSSLEPLDGVTKGKGGEFDMIPVQFLKTDFLGITHMRTLEDGWAELDKQDGFDDA